MKMNKKKENWEEEAKDRFIAALKAMSRGDWVVSDSDVVVDKQTNRNFDYQLQRDKEFIALEIFRLVETPEEIKRSKSWSTIANGIAAELRTRGIKGYTIHTPNTFNIPRAKIPRFVSNAADLLHAAVKQKPDADSIQVDGFEIKSIQGFPDVLFTTGHGGAVNPTGTAYDFIVKLLPTKNKQLDVANHERIILIVNWEPLVGQSDMIEACTLSDFSEFNNIDKVYFEIPQAPGHVQLVYDRKVYAAFQPGAEPPQQIDPLFISWLANHLYRKETQAFQLVRKITDQQKSLLWLPALSREQLVTFGEQFLKSGQLEQLHWIVENLKNDPDPSVENAANDPEGELNDHLRTKRGENTRLIRTVRVRLCWLLMQIIARPCLEHYEKVFEIVERYATEEHLYVRQNAAFALMELARRRFASIGAGVRFMSDDLAARIKTLTLRMVEENSEYPVVLEAVAKVMLFVLDLDHDTALKTVQQLLTMEDSDGADAISSVMIYFALIRENEYKHSAPFNSKPLKELLLDRLANGSDRFRASATSHFKNLLALNRVQFETLVPYLEAVIGRKSNRLVNHHFYEITAKQTPTNPDTIARLVELAVLGELKSLDSGAREVWHPRSFSECLRALEQAGPDHKERVARIRMMMEPY